MRFWTKLKERVSYRDLIATIALLLMIIDMFL